MSEVVGRKFLRVRDVVEKTGVSRRTIYRWMESGDFPRQIRLSHGIAVWQLEDVEAWMAAR